jgi:hypothetical protein
MTSPFDERLAKEFVYEIWDIVQRDSVASSRIGQPSSATRKELADSLRTLFLDLIAEAKPERYKESRSYDAGYNKGLDAFENNLIQAINGGKK